MQVFLKENVLGVGKAGTIANVQPGFARNYLFRRKLGVPATPQLMAQAQHASRKQQQHLLQERAEVEKLFQALGETPLTLTERAKGDRLFGSVTRETIVDAVKNQLNLQLDARFMELSAPIKSTGMHIVPVRHQDLTGAIHLTINPHA